MSINPEWSYLIWPQVWQCTLLALVVWLICRLVRIRRAHLTYLLWLVVLLKFVTPPLWSSSSGLFCWMQSGLTEEVVQSSAAQQTDSLTRTEWIRRLIGDDVDQLPEAERPSVEVTIHDPQDRPTEETTAHSLQAVAAEAATAAPSVRRSPRMSWLSVGFWIWTGMAALIATVMLVRFLRCWQMIRRAGVVNSPELDQLLVRLCSELGLKRRIRLVVTHSRIGPAVIGLFRPTILLPAVIAESRTREELKPILAHELIHIRRGDLWIGLLQLLASIVWWFHPLVWLTGRRLKFEMEQCCDEEVLAELKCDPRRYAGALLEILELKQTLKTVPMVPGVRPVEITSKRMERIMRLGQGSQKRTPWWCWVVFVTLAAVVLPGAAFVVSAGDDSKRDAIDSKLKLTDDRPLQTEIKVIKQQPETIDQLPFYHPLKQQAHQARQSFNKSLSTDLDYLSSEIDLRAWVTRTGCVRCYPVGDLLKKSRQAVGAGQARANLKQQIFKRLKELSLNYPDHLRPDDVPAHPLFIGPHQIPLKDERTVCYGRIYAMHQLFEDQFLVSSSDPRYHQCVAQTLAELRSGRNAEQDLNSMYVLTTRIMSVPKSQLQKISSHRRNVKVFQEEQIPELPVALKGKYRGTENSEIVSQRTLVCEILDDDRVTEVEQLVNTTADSQILAEPQVCFLDGQTVQIQTGQLHAVPMRGFAAHISLSSKIVTGFDLRLTYSTEKGVNGRGMLEYQIAKSDIGGMKILKPKNPETAVSKHLSVPLLIKRHFKDARLIEPGKTLLLGGLTLNEQTDESKSLLVLLKLEKGKPLEESEVRQGAGVNSDAGVTGQILLDESNFNASLRTQSYPVSDLVVPVPRLLLKDSVYTLAPAERPRFEPLIELIQQNVRPEAWEKNGFTIRAFEKDLSLVVRANQATHDQIADLIARVRAVQDQRVSLELEQISTDDLTAWLETWNKGASPVSHELWKLLQSNTLEEGRLLTSTQAKILKQILKQSENAKRVNRTLKKMTPLNGVTMGYFLSDPLFPHDKSKSPMQLRPELLNDQRVRLSYVINARNAQDAISYAQTVTIPRGKSFLIDITEQLLRDHSSFRFDEFVRQAGLSYQKQGKRCFLLVTPSLPEVGDKKE
ncbi:Regulatory protein BlaR1 [Gimesia panareensis]|uniref:Regulatory protein BlaR1 n=2 Tax=Gimesia panareensis TaxID=2527978 RepID=A0A518FXP5_9PLAN|nr:Regulatory protein BlaR1 [Gimesia panareensis]